MFDPSKVEDAARSKREARDGIERIESWVAEMLQTSRVRATVNEVQCGDPNCAPVDTVLEFWAEPNIHWRLGLSKRATDVVLKDVKEIFPAPDVIDSWSSGVDAEWPRPGPPPRDDCLDHRLGDEVDVFLGIRWHRAKVVQLWYRDKFWPKDCYMPYKVVGSFGESYVPCPERIRTPAENRQLLEPIDTSPHQPAWRFRVGDQVLCRCSDGWLKGEVKSRDVQDPSEPLGFALVPYMVLLDAPISRCIAVPFDDDWVIKRRQ